MARLIAILIAFLSLSCKQLESQDNTPPDLPRVEIKDPIIFDVINIRSSPRLETFWAEEMPSFVFCKSSGISSHRAFQGISYWRRLGYPIENVRYIEDGPECHFEPPVGTVVIRMIDNTIAIGDHLAVTKVFYYTETKKILRANIYLISAYANRARLIEHEIGHALGWRHYNRRLHIMNSEYDSTGHDSHGVSYRRYQELFSNFF